MADILGKDLDLWENSTATEYPFNLKAEDTELSKYISGGDLLKSLKINQNMKVPVEMKALSYDPTTPKFIQPFISMGRSAVDAIVNAPDNLKNLAAQIAVERLSGEKTEKSAKDKIIDSLLGGTEIGELNRIAAEGLGTVMTLRTMKDTAEDIKDKAKTYDEAIDLLNNREYPIAKYARRVLSETTDNVETRRVVHELYNQAQGIDSSKWYNQAGAIIGAMLPDLALTRGVYKGARLLGAGRANAVRAATNIMTGVVGVEEAGRYAEETAAQYIERTGDKTFENFTAKDATGLSAMAYGAISGRIEFMGGVEPIVAGAITKIGLRSSLGKAFTKSALQEGAEEFGQGIAELLTRKIDGTSDKTWKQGFEEALTGAVWGALIGGPIGTTAFYTNRRNLVKGIKNAIPNINDTQAQQIADAMIDSTAEMSTQDSTLRGSLRQKVELMYRDSDIENKEDIIDATTDLEYSLIAMDSAERGIDLADNPLFNGEVNELGWFREGIPTERRAEIQEINDNIVDLKNQLTELNKAQEKDWTKIEEIENKLAQANQYVLDKLSELVRDDSASVRRMFEELEGRYVAKEKERALDSFEATTEQKELAKETANLVLDTLAKEGIEAQVVGGQNKQRAHGSSYLLIKRPGATDIKIRFGVTPVGSRHSAVVANFNVETVSQEEILSKIRNLVKEKFAKNNKTKDVNVGFESTTPMFQEEQYSGDTIVVDGVERIVYNSNGDKIADSAEALTNFWRWFGDSKVVDEQGRPLVVYHGTGVRFNEFDNVFGRRGIYFTDSKIVASSYQGVNGGRERIIMPVYVKVGNPFVIDFDGSNYVDVPQIVENYKFEDLDDVVSWAKEKGYDGVIAKNIKDPSSTSASWEAMRTIANDYVAFEPTQIKSVDNRGTFSSDTGNIYWQSAYAGSRVDYDRPSLEAIDSGEGNQSHGWGLYYALNPEIAEMYRNTFMQKSDNYDVDEYEQTVELLGRDGAKKDWENQLSQERESIALLEKSDLDKPTLRELLFFKKQRANKFERLIQMLKSGGKGQVVEVNIPEMDVLLDEQKTFDQQTPFVQEAVKKATKEASITDITENSTGDEIYEALREYHQSAKDASKMLEKYGIKGITYNGRRDGRCFVIFNPESVKVLRKKFDELGNALFQNRVSGGAPATYRGAYIPEYRFILRANRMDASTLSHELAHDWFEVNFNRYRSGNATKDFMRAWGVLEKALGVPENATRTPRQASETFARAYEAWVTSNEDWSKFIAVEDKDKDKVEKLLKDYQGELRDIYNDISNPYFKQTWGKLGELKPELKAWFDRVVNITDLDTLVERGEITTEEAGVEKLNRAIDTVIENTADEESTSALKIARTLNDTERYEAEGGNKNSLQRRLSALAREIDENNMVVKGEKYDTRRDMLAVAQAADNFVKTRLDDALAIINGQMAEVEGLYKEDLYTALERLAIENGDLGLIDELKNSEVANRLAKELGQRVAGFRNFKQSTDLDVVSALKSLDNKFNKALENKKAQKEFDSALKLLDDSIKQQDKIADKELDKLLTEWECR